MDQTFYKNVFFLGGLWNIGMGVFGLVFGNLATSMLLGNQALNGGFYQVLFFKIIQDLLFYIQTNISIANIARGIKGFSLLKYSCPAPSETAITACPLFFRRL